jgi:hypothetical protein
MAVTQEYEDCEVIEIDAEQSEDGTLMYFQVNSNQGGRKAERSFRSFNEVVRILESAGWRTVQSGRDPATGNKVGHMQRPRQPDRAIDDARDRLQS